MARTASINVASGAASNRKRHVVAAFELHLAAVSVGKIRQMALRHGGSKIKGDCPMPLELLNINMSCATSWWRLAPCVSNGA